MIPRGVEGTKAMLHDALGRVVAQRTVVGPPEILEHEGRRFELVDAESGWARYMEIAQS